jgi:glycosyltransferase involved in cell wall biosynthesis
MNDDPRPRSGPTTPRSAVPSATAVITCMTDAERPFIQEAVESVLGQTVATPLVLCVTDTNTWIDDIPGTQHPSVQILRMPLSPLGVVRNAGLTHVGTDTVAFLDGDDAWQPTKIERQLELMEAHQLDVLGTKHVLIREDSRPFFYAFAQNIPMPSSWMGRTAVFREHPFVSRHIGEDVQLWLEIQSEYRCAIAEAFLLRYRVRAGSLSQETPSMRRKLQYERRSHAPGGRQALLAGSYAANVGLALKRKASRRVEGPVARVR